MKLILTLIAMLIAPPVLADTHTPACGLKQIVEARLQAKFGEGVLDERTQPAPANPDVMITWRLWLNQRTGSWTLTGTRDDVMCVFGGGLDGYSGKLLDDYLVPVADPAGLKL